jgi:hypothetical protein
MDAQAQNTTAETWRQRVVAQQASGQSIRDWCRANGCQEHAFYTWRVRLGLSPATTRKPRRRAAGVERVRFAKVVFNDSTSRQISMGLGEPIRVSLLGGRELALPGSMSVESIAKLLRAIEGVA